ncbi:MAG TPA: alkaline phosphatase D family protein [Ktedonobacteraceae bacterium]|nr:alkaline phosphatase D family protein [Ktedonobacteraceae bacterium]
MTHISIGPLVRATSANSVTIWVECTQPCTVTLKVLPIESGDAPLPTGSSHTVIVGGHHYALVYLDGLQPATWYTYHLDIDGQEDIESVETTSEQHFKHQDTAPQLYCFRTMNVHEAGQAASQQTRLQLRLAYGSCRTSEDQEDDALSAFGSWLISHYEQREEQWPHLLLLIGDQIYADQPPAALKKVHPQLEQRASTFEDFALLYEYAWTKDSNVRQALAVVPTYMIFDDHEITDNWDTAPTWRAEALKKGWEQMLIDGLVAYWVYQGWGNLERRTQRDHSPLLTIMQEAEQHGQDILESLRVQIKEELYGRTDLHWHYTLPTVPAIFVADARVGRTAVFSDSKQEIYAPARIMSQQQMNELRTWVHTNTTGPLLLISSVPLLLPPAIGFIEYMAGKRFWRSTPLQWLGQHMAQLQQKVARKASFDHWPVYSATWQEFIHLLDECDQDMLILSGDVHFSYAMQAQRTGRKKQQRQLYQLVCTPLQNILSPRDRTLIEKQAPFSRISYGGLHTQMLPLYTADMKARVPHDILFQNTIALVTIETEEDGSYTVQQEYLGSIGGIVRVVGRTEPFGDMLSTPNK